MAAISLIPDFRNHAKERFLSFPMCRLDSEPCGDEAGRDQIEICIYVQHQLHTPTIGPFALASGSDLCCELRQPYTASA